MKAEKTNSVSVIIPTFNGSKFVLEALGSVYNQSIRPLEVIVVDDGSTDDTLNLIDANFKSALVIKQEHTGMPTAGRNRGVKMAKGEYIAFLDQDDTWPIDAIEKHLKVFSENPKARLSKGLVNEWHESLSNANAKESQQFLLASLMVHKSVFKEVGYFDEGMQYFGSDLEWIYRLREKGVPVHFHKDISLFYRLHEANHSKSYSLSLKARQELMMKVLLRKRKALKSGIAYYDSFNLVGNSLNLEI